MVVCEVALYQNRKGISADIVYPDGRFSSGCCALDPPNVVDELCQQLKNYSGLEVIIHIKPKTNELTAKDCPLDGKKLAEIKQLLELQDYKVR